MNACGTFLVFGRQCEPAVVILSSSAHAFLRDQLRIASRHGKDELRHAAYRQAFQIKGVEYAVPAWSVEAMTAIATEYTGAHEKRIRGLAACLATSTPYGPDSANPSGTDASGGQRAPIDPVKPKPRKPNGGARQLATAGAQS